MNWFIIWIYLEDIKINASAIAIFILTKRLNKGIFSIWNLRVVSKRDSTRFLFCYFRKKFHKLLKNHFQKPLRIIELHCCGENDYAK